MPMLRDEPFGKPEQQLATKRDHLTLWLTVGFSDREFEPVMISFKSLSTWGAKVHSALNYI